MRDGWHYVLQGKPVGTFPIDKLIPLLRTEAEPGAAQVWKEGFEGWRLPKDVPEIAPLLGASRNKQRLIAFLIALIIAFGIAAALSTIIYGNSGEGVGYLIGQFLGVGAFASLVSFSARRKTYTPAIVLVVTALIVGGMNTTKLLESIDGRQGMAALSAIHDPSQIDQALKQNPSNTFLQLMARAEELSQETGRTTAKLSDEIEPKALNDMNFDFATATREGLATYRRDLKTAAQNAEQALPRYVAILKKERADVEDSSRSLKISPDMTRALLSGVDKRQARLLAFSTKMFAARAEFYRALENYVAILIEQFGQYKVEANGQFRFVDRAALDRFNAALNAVSAALKKVNELDVERKQLQQSDQENWQQFRSTVMH